MEHQEFPKWKYQGAKGVLVNNAGEESALDEGFSDQPTAEPEAAPVDPRDAEIAALKATLAKATKADKAKG